MGRLIIAEFKDNETHPFDEIMEVFRKYPDFQKYKVDYTPTLSFSDLEILPDQRRVHCGKQEVSLTTKEFNLLCYLAANEGRVGLLTGFIVGGCIGVLAWAFLQNLFAIPICASIGMLIGIVIGTVIDYEKTSKEIDKIDDSLKGKS